MENFGKFIDDIRKEIKWLNVTFEEVPFGESMIITIPPSSKKYIVDTRKIGKIEYDTPMYSELLEMTIEHLKRFNESDENLNISDVSESIEETIEIGGRKYKKILSSLSEIAKMQDKIKAGISIMGDIGYIKLPEDDKIYILLYSH